MDMNDDFRNELTGLINRHSIENGSDTPDFLLAEFLCQQIAIWNECVTRREQWFGRSGGMAYTVEEPTA